MYNSNTATSDGVGGCAIESSSSGSININGGVYYSSNRTINVSTSSTANVNIRNAKIISGWKGLQVTGTNGTINICDSVVEASKYDISIPSTGTITYNNVTFSNGTTSPDNDKVYNPNGTITQSDTCPISE